MSGGSGPRRAVEADVIPLSIIRVLTYHLRRGTLADADAIVHHRIAMFTDMGIPLDGPALDRHFRAWLTAMMPAGTYHAWLIETDTGEIVAGGGASVLPWPPGPRYMGDRIAVVYNVYTEPAHRHQGLARSVMDAIHGWCRDEGITSVALNASADGRPLYESMGYQVPPNPMMFLGLTQG
jgi:GNAT superfamily N-acetyltransferase